MKNVKVNHTYTLKDILIDIKNVGGEIIGYVDAYDAMQDRIQNYLDMIENE